VRTFLGLEPDGSGAEPGRLLQRWLDTVVSVPAIAVPLDLPGLPYHRLTVLSGRLEAAIREMIALRRGGAPAGGDVLSRLTGAGNAGDPALSDDELVGATSFLFMAGHATTASALTWALFLLCATPSVLADLVDELDGTLRGDPPDLRRLGRLDLLDRVVKESLRLLPPVTWWSRVSAAPCRLGRYDVPAGAHVAYSAYITHRRPELYPRPARFRPDRWLTCTPGPYGYLPFSGGPRTCLGSGFAVLEIKLVLAVILQRWGLALRPGQRVDPGGLVVSAPRRGLLVRPVPRGVDVGPPDIRGGIRAVVDLDAGAPTGRASGKKPAAAPAARVTAEEPTLPRNPRPWGST
jgi:cytochrome P450